MQAFLDLKHYQSASERIRVILDSVKVSEIPFCWITFSCAKFMLHFSMLFYKTSGRTLLCEFRLTSILLDDLRANRS